MDVLIEVHDLVELTRALEVDNRLIGVNNRDLRTFEVDLATTERLARRLASERDLASGGDVVLVSESGILHHADVRRLESVGARGFLVGESLMREPDLGQALRRLRRPA